MAKGTPEVDAYIAAAGEYARPILRKIRGLFHKACPKIAEVMKWGAPHFEHKGIVGCMAAFKHHVSIGFWKGSLLNGAGKIFGGVGTTSWNGLKVKALTDLPDDKVLLEAIGEAVALNEQGIKDPRRAKKPKSDVAIPDYFVAALRKNKTALATFEALSPSHKREYVEWITEAKQVQTRARRLATTLEWLTEGKRRNWKYENC